MTKNLSSLSDALRASWLNPEPPKVICHREQLQNVARSLLGCPYKHLGRDPDQGLDCWGLVIEFFHRLGIELENPVSDYRKDWWQKQNLILEHVPSVFAPTAGLAPGVIASMAVQNSTVPNHLAVFIDNSYLLNIEENVGAHLLRYFSIKKCVKKLFRYKYLELVS